MKSAVSSKRRPSLRASLTACRVDGLTIIGHARLEVSCTVTPMELSELTGFLIELSPLQQQLRVAREERLMDQSTQTRELIRNLGEFPRVLKAAAALREPHRVCRYLEDLAGDYHRFYDSCRVLPQGDEAPGDLHAARLALCSATRQVIANGLQILGVTAPERM